MPILPDAPIISIFLPYFIASLAAIVAAETDIYDRSVSVFIRLAAEIADWNIILSL